MFKMFVFALAAALGGLGGMLYTPQMGIITPEYMTAKWSILFVIWVAVGGRGTMSGAVLGAIGVNLVYNFLTTRWPGGMAVCSGVTVCRRGVAVSKRHRRSAGLDPFQPLGQAQCRGMNTTELIAEYREFSPRINRIGARDFLLFVEDLTAVFDGFKAVDIDAWGVKRNELRVVIGPNGAGKTTLCDLVSGKTRPTTGTVFFEGDDITHALEADIALRGIGRKFQTPRVYESLTTFENMELALPGSRQVRNFSAVP